MLVVYTELTVGLKNIMISKTNSKISLVITEKVEALDAQKDIIIVRFINKKPQKYPLISLREIILYISCSIKSKALCNLSKGNIPLLIVDYRGQYMGHFQPGTLKNFYPRKSQFEKYFNEEKKLFTGIKIVEEKLNTIVRFTKERKSKINESFVQKLEEVENFDVLRGIEGAYTKEHYRNLENWLKPSGFSYESRSKRPPSDPVNCLLSLTYTLTMNMCLSSINLIGLDPAFGFLHEDYYGRPSLACDLMEKWRIDMAERFVLRTLNRKEITKEHFEFGGPAEGCFLNDEGRKVFYSKWFPYANEEERKNFGFRSPLTFRQAILTDIRRFSKFLMDEV